MRDSLLPQETAGRKDYSSPGGATLVNAAAEEVDMLDYDYRVIGSGLVNDTYTIRSRAPTLTQGTLTQYQLIDAENAPSSYERVFKTNGTSSMFPTVTNDGLSVSPLSDGSKKYSITKKTLPTAVSRPANPTHPTNYTQLRYQKWNGEEWVTVGAVPSTWYDCSTWADYYPASGVTSSVKSVRVYPVSTTNLVQYAIQPASKTNATLTEHTSQLTVTYKKLQVTEGQSQTKTFLLGD